jgi:hypothetical protein
MRANPTALSRKPCEGQRAEFPSHLPEFVCDLIQNGWDKDGANRPTFAGIFDILAGNNFKVTPDVDSNQIMEYIRPVDGTAPP